MARGAEINTPAARMRFTRLMKKIKESYEENEGIVNQQEMEETASDNGSNDAQTAAKAN